MRHLREDVVYMLQNMRGRFRMKNGEKLRILYIMNSCKKAGPTEQTFNIIRNLDTEKFEPVLLTLRKEPQSSILSKYLPYVKHYYAPVSLFQMLFFSGIIYKVIDKINPDIIHPVGVIPGYTMCRRKEYNNIIVLRNYCYEAFPAQFGLLRGSVLTMLQLNTIKRADKIVCCSNSLMRRYADKLNIPTLCICNGVDLETYSRRTEEERISARARLGIPDEIIVYAYLGQILPIKNVEFLVNGFKKYLDLKKDCYLLVLGGGDMLSDLKCRYSDNRICFLGEVKNVRDYLCAADVYISASYSEGMPNSVLEAMAIGLPVILSDIEPHKEILSHSKNAGTLFQNNNYDDYISALDKLNDRNIAKLMGNEANKNVSDNYNSVEMSKKYQSIYREMVL